MLWIYLVFWVGLVIVVGVLLVDEFTKRRLALTLFAWCGGVASYGILDILLG